MLLISWSKFTIYALCIFVAGYSACKYGNLISKKSRISEGFMGVFFLALATSSPEIFTAISAVKVNMFDLALGDIFGSLLSNLFILIMLDFFISKGGFLKKSSDLRGISIVIILQALIIVSIFLRSIVGLSLDIFNFGVESLFIAVLYLFFLKGELKDNREFSGDFKSKIGNSCIKEWSIFIASLFAIVFFAQLIVVQSKIIVESSMLNYLFFGTLFLGLVTSLPELIVTVSALINRSHSMAIGNIIGSNAIDIAILPILELTSFRIPIFSKVSLPHIYTLVAVELATLALLLLIKYGKINRIYSLILLLLLIVPLIIIF